MKKVIEGWACANQIKTFDGETNHHINSLSFLCKELGQHTCGKQQGGCIPVKLTLETIEPKSAKNHRDGEDE